MCWREYVLIIINSLAGDDATAYFHFLIDDTPVMICCLSGLSDRERHADVEYTVNWSFATSNALYKVSVMLIRRIIRHFRSGIGPESTQ